MSGTPNKESGGDRDRTVSENSESEFDPQYKPIITLPEVEIPTNEEEEDLMVKLRAKLFRFDTKTDDTPEWKERGTGEVKLLKHNVNKTVRIVMRRDKTLKVCANHFITPWMELKPSKGSERAFVYNVLADFADETPKAECLAIRFGTVDIANQFKEKFNEAKHFVRTECHLYSEDKENLGDSESEDNSEIIEKKNINQEDPEVKVTKKLSELDVTGKGKTNELETKKSETNGSKTNESEVNEGGTTNN